MPTFRIVTKSVTKDGRISGLKELAGEDVYIVPKPRVKVPEGRVPEDARRLLADLQAYVRAHRDLAREQVGEFRKKHEKTLTLEDLRKDLAKDVEEAVKVAREEIALVGGRVRGIAKKTSNVESEDGTEVATASTNGASGK